MAVYTNDLRLKEIATGDESGTWGTSTNTNLSLIADAFSFGTEAITTNADTHTTTIADGAADPGRSIFLKYTGTLDSACTITIGPNTVSKLWLIENATSGSQNIIIKQGSGATVTIANGQTKAIYSDGAGSGGAMVDAFQDLSIPDLFIDDDLTFTSDSAVITFGADGDTTLTHTDGSGLTLNSTNKLMFNDASQFIQGSSATVLSLGATDEIDLTATAIDINGTVDMSSTLTVGGEVFIAEKLTHTGDTDTHFKFAGANDIRIVAGDVEHAAFDGTIVFNQSGADMDFRVESDNNANMLVVDAGNDRIGIGTNAPTSPLTVTMDAGGIATFTGISSGGVSSVLMKQSRGSISSPSNSATAGDGNYMLSQVYNSGYATIGSIGIITGSALNNGEIQFNTASSGTVAERLRITASGSLQMAGTGTDNDSNPITFVNGACAIARDANDLEIHAFDNIIFGVSNTSYPTSTERMRIDSAGLVTITRADNGQNLRLTTTDTDANAGPIFNLFRDSSSPANNDFLGNITFDGRNDAAEKVQYAEQEVYITDKSDGAEDGLVNWNVLTNGTNLSYFQLRAETATSVFNEDSNDMDFRVESNNNANMLFVDGGNDAVSVGASITDSTFSVSTTSFPESTEKLTEFRAGFASANYETNRYIKLTQSFTGSAQAAPAIVWEANANGSNQKAYGLIHTQADGSLSFQNIGAKSAVSVGSALGTLQKLLIGIGEAVFNEQSLDYDFRVESDGNTHMLFVDAGNNRVGVGKSSPSFPLEVANPDAAETTVTAAFRAGSDADNNRSNIFIGQQDNSRGLIIQGGREIGDRAIAEFILNGSGGTIGSNIVNFLQCYEQTGSTAFEVTFNQDGENIDFRFESDTGTHALGVDAGNDCVFVGTTTSSSDAVMQVGGDAANFSIKMDNNFGAGTALYINNQSSTGWIAARFLTAGTLVGFISVSTTATAYSVSGSDERLKENIQDWDENVLESFKNLKPKTFNFIADEEKKNQKGYIAQDLVDSFPEAYPLEPKTDRYHFNPSGMVVYLMKAIQEQQEQIEELKTEIAKLKGE